MQGESVEIKGQNLFHMEEMGVFRIQIAMDMIRALLKTNIKMLL